MKNILQIKFEDFVKNYEKEQKKILYFLKIKKKIIILILKQQNLTYLKQEKSYLILKKTTLKISYQNIYNGNFDFINLLII